MPIKSKNTKINWIFAILQRSLVYTAPVLKFKSAFKILQHGQIRTNSHKLVVIVMAAVNTKTSIIDFVFFSASACVNTAAIVNICRQMFSKAYKPIRFGRLRKLKSCQQNEYQPHS